eukprot:INCI9221.4.p1 GENE.INCI9221.4~~INCI9221.4.p1  ORF type:complete len:192 (-),score=39.11 INCI9221.4:167-742(-)
MLMEEDVQSGGRGAVTALKTFVSDDEAAPRKESGDRQTLLESQEDAIALDLDDIEMDAEGDAYGNKEEAEVDDSPGKTGKGDEEEIAKSHPSTQYLVARYYTRRFSIIIYETCVCVLATVVLILGVIDTALLTSDPILFAVTFVLALLTYSSGVVLTIALGFPLLNCKRKRAHTSSTITARDLDPLELDMT